jgi:hypothetical protein
VQVYGSTRFPSDRRGRSRIRTSILLCDPHTTFYCLPLRVSLNPPMMIFRHSNVWLRFRKAQVHYMLYGRPISPTLRSSQQDYLRLRISLPLPSTTRYSPQIPTTVTGRIRNCHVKRYTQILPTAVHMLGSDDLGLSIDWCSDRTWLDESVKATRRNNLDDWLW